MMQAGYYYVGDLCYVLNDEWDEACELFFQGRDDHGCNEGEFTLKDGRRFASFNTMYGDGCYEDQYGNEYGVDAGLIGCIRVEDIGLDPTSFEDKRDGHSYNGGHIFFFKKDFVCVGGEDNRRKWDGVIRIGHLKIDTDPSYDEDTQEEDDRESTY